MPFGATRIGWAVEKKFRKRKRERSGKRAGRSAELEVMYGFAWGYDFFEFLEGKRKPFSAEGNRPRGRLEKGCPRLCVRPSRRAGAAGLPRPKVP